MIMKKHTSRRVRCWPQCPSKGNAGSEDGDVNEMAMDHRYLRQSESSPFLLIHGGVKTKGTKFNLTC